MSKAEPEMLTPTDHSNAPVSWLSLSARDCLQAIQYAAARLHANPFAIGHWSLHWLLLKYRVQVDFYSYVWSTAWAG